jgi:hypothetical protein
MIFLRGTLLRTFAVGAALLTAGCVHRTSNGESVDPDASRIDTNTDPLQGVDAGGANDAGTCPAIYVLQNTTGVDAGAADANDSQCFAASTCQGCIACCVSDHPTGYATFQAALTSCACGATGACQSACASEYCAGKNPTPGDACDSCLSGVLENEAGPSCVAQVVAACENDLTCLALYGPGGCTDGCPGLM